MTSCFLLLLLPCLYAGYNECYNYVEINDTTRNVNHADYDVGRNGWSREHCDKNVLNSSVWVRFIAAGNEVVPTSPPDHNRCNSRGSGYQTYNSPTTLYATTTGTICYRYGALCHLSSTGSTTLCPGYYVYRLTPPTRCVYRVCTTAGMMSASPTMKPTIRPTNPCVDIYDYCIIVAANGYCYHDDRNIRIEVQSMCPHSCGTCFNTTIVPTLKPSMLPTSAPTTPTITPTQTPPTDIPTAAPSTVSPSVGPTIRPTSKPSMPPTLAPTTNTPTVSPPTDTPTAAPSTLAPSVGPTVKPSDSPSPRPSFSPTCGDLIGYCQLISTSCSTAHPETKIYMTNNCASSCGFCSAAPTGAPTFECIDRYGYCRNGSLAGACTAKNYEARVSFLYDCPVSCGTCHGETLTPTTLPTIKPTSEPTIVPTLKPSLNPSKQPTYNPTSGPTKAPTCQDLVDYCNYVKGSCTSADVAIREKMHDECASTCGLCTLQPTASPTAPCVDLYSWCSDLAMNGACFSSDHEARMRFQSDCPLSCNTCYNQTASPSYQPTLTPTIGPSSSPTLSPVCLDTIGYCNLLKGYCNSDEISLRDRARLQEGCSYTCLFCTEGSIEHSAVGVGFNHTQELTVPTMAPQKETRRIVTEQIPGSADFLIVVGSMSTVTILACLLRCALLRSEKTLRLVRRYFNQIAHLKDFNGSSNRSNGVY